MSHINPPEYINLNTLETGENVPVTFNQEEEIVPELPIYTQESDNTVVPEDCHLAPTAIVAGTFILLAIMLILWVALMFKK